MSEPRSHVVWRHVTLFINKTGTSWPTYCADVAEHYHTTVPGPLRKVEFSLHRDPHERMRLNAQTVRRFEHDHKFGLPNDLEDAMVMALPQSRRFDLQADLAARTGLLAAPIPEIGPAHDALGVAGMMRETAEAIEAIAPMLESDGVIDHKDAHLAGHAEQQLLEAMGALRSMLARVHRAKHSDKKLREVG
ncbi:MAG: hypothetical protein IMF06_05410 [Proteobacteria bacterium]|nr:hypothetical protein [Pseudomonadota bacterium]